LTVSDEDKDRKSGASSQPDISSPSDKNKFERSDIDSKAPDISSRPEDWDGFQDPFWNLGQVILWIATRSPKYVDGASDASGALGKNTASSDTYGRVAAGEQIKKQLTSQQFRDAVVQIKQQCVAGTLNAMTQSKSLSPDQWRHLDIVVNDHVPTVVWRNYPKVAGAGGHATPDLRFRRDEVLRRFPPNTADFTEIPDAEPRQPRARTAYKAIKQLYPDNRIPSTISDETLARRAQRISSAHISREDVRRALGKKK
jgi:hypothetical protein